MNSAPLTVEQQFESLKAAVQKLHDECAPYLKDGEGIVERLARYYDETQQLVGELAKERITKENLVHAIVSELPSGMASMVLEKAGEK